MGLFDNAASVVINNKEVHSIITSNGGVLYEKPSPYVLTLTSDKSIIQTGDTAVLTATLTNNNVPVSGETIRFTANTILNAETKGGGSGLGDDYYLTVSTGEVFIGRFGGFFHVTPTTIRIAPGGTYTNSYSYDGGKIHVKNGVLTYTDTSDVEQTIDVSELNPLRVYSGSGFFEWYYVDAVTDANGEASVSYVGKGAGVLNIHAVDIERIIQSETYEVLDTLYYDEAVIGHKNVCYSIPSTGSVSTDETGTTVSLPTQYSAYRLQDENNVSVRFKADPPFVFEIDILQSTYMRLSVYQSDGVLKLITLRAGHWKVIIKDNKAIYSVDNGTSTETTFEYTNKLQIWLQSRSADASFKFKNLKVYPV